jgi:hypothetical protein
MIGEGFEGCHFGVWSCEGVELAFEDGVLAAFGSENEDETFGH